MATSKSPFRTDLKPLDTLLFGDDDENKREEIRQIPLEQLYPFKDHPFRLYAEDKMREMAASIAEHGVMTPLIVRPHPDGEPEHYEIISGHNRHEGARQAGLDEVPVIVRDVDDATAILMMISSNFEQRDELLPSEKAFAYKMQLEAIKQQGKRTDLGIIGRTSDPGGQKLNGMISREVVAEASGVGTSTISRYVRLTDLIPPLLEHVDNSRINIKAGALLSDLPHDHQNTLHELMSIEGKVVTEPQAARMKALHDNGTLNEMEMVRILHEKPEPLLASVKITKRLQEYIPRDTLPKDAENLIISAMDMRSIALSRMPEGIGEKEARDLLDKALDLYARMGFDHSSTALEHQGEETGEEEDMEP